MAGVPFPGSTGLPQPEPGYAGLGDFLFGLAKERRRQQEFGQEQERKDFYGKLALQRQSEMDRKNAAAEERQRAMDYAKILPEIRGALTPENIKAFGGTGYAEALGRPFGISGITAQEPPKPEVPIEPQAAEVGAPIFREAEAQAGAQRGAAMGQPTAEPTELDVRIAQQVRPDRPPVSDTPDVGLDPLMETALAMGRKRMSEQLATPGFGAADEEYRQKRGSYEQLMAAMPERYKQYETDLAAAKEKPVYAMQTPFGEATMAGGATLEARQRAADQWAQRQITLAPRSTPVWDPVRKTYATDAQGRAIMDVDPRYKESVETVQKAIATGQVDPGKGGDLLARLTGQIKPDYERELEAGRMKRGQMMSAAVARRASVSEAFRQAGLDERALDRFWRRSDALVKRADLPDDLAGYRDLKESLTKLGSGNPAEQNQVRFSLARAMAGPGVMSNQDFSKTVERISGVLGSVETWFSRVQDGTISDRELGVIAQAVADTLPAQDARIENTRKQWVRAFTAPTWRNLQQVVNDEELAIFGAMGRDIESRGLTGGPVPGQRVVPGGGKPASRSGGSSTRVTTKGMSVEENKAFLEGLGL